MPQSYEQLRSGFDLAKSQGYNFDDLPSYVRYLAGDDPSAAAEYGAGSSDGFLKQLNYRINQDLEFTALPAVGRDVGEYIGGTLGAPETGREAGGKLGRGLANLIPLTLTGGSTLPVQAAGMLGSGGLAALDTYGEGGGAGAAAAVGALTAAVPVFSHFGSKLGAFLSGAPKVEGFATGATPGVFGTVGEAVSTRIPQTVAQRLAAYTGSQVAALAPFGAMDAIQAKIDGRDNPLFSKEWWVGTLVGQLPFMGLDLGRIGGPEHTAAKVQGTLSKVNPAARKPVEVKTETFETNPQATADADALLASMKAKTDILARADLDEEQKATLLQAADLQQNKALVMGAGVKSITQLGTTITPTVDSVTFTGKVVHETPANPTVKNPGHQGSYFVQVDVANKLGYAGKVMAVPKKMATVNPDGTITVPTRFTSEVVDRGGLIKPEPTVEQTPDLVNQDQPGEIKPGPETPVLGKAGELPVNPDWTSPIPEFERRIAAARAAQQAHKELADSTPDVPTVDLETAKANLVATDKINAQLDNSVPPVSDPILAEGVAKQVEKGETLSDASQVVVESHKVKAKDRVIEGEKKQTRQEKKLIRQLEVAVEFGQLEEAQRAAGVTENRTPEADDLIIINDAIEKYGNQSGGRMLDFPDELKAAYLNWRAGTKPGLEEGKVKQSLGALVQKVLSRMQLGKVVTGGKVLRKDGKWSEKSEKGNRQTFVTKEEAETALDLAKTLETGLQNPRIMTFKDKNGLESYYLMERPRQSSVEFDTANPPSQAQVGKEVVTLPKAPTDSKNVGTEGIKVAEVKQAHVEQTLAITKEDVRNAVQEVGEVVDEDYVDKAAARLAILDKAILDGELPTVLKSNADGLKYQGMLKKQGLEFTDMDSAQDFSASDIVEVLRRNTLEQLKSPVVEPGPKEGFEWVNIESTRDPRIDPNINALQGRDPIAFIEGMVQRTLPGSPNKAIGEILLQYKKELADVQVKIIPGSNRAFYDTRDNSVSIGENYFTSVNKADYAFAHELAHALSVKLINANPEHPAVLELERLRQHAISALPKEVRQIFDHWEATDLMTKHSEGQTVDWGMDTKDAWYKVLYGLTNNREFVSQTFSQPEFQGYLSTVKVPAQKRTFVKWFTDTIAKLFGKSDHQQLSNALEQSFVASNRVFDAQRSFIHYEQLAKQQYLNEGMNPAIVPLRLRSLRDSTEVSPMGTPEQQSRTYLNWMSEGFKTDRASGVLTPLERQASDLAYGQWQKMSEPERMDQMELVREVTQQVHKDYDSAMPELTALDKLPEEYWLNLAPATLRHLEAMSRYGKLQMEVLRTQELAANENLTNVRPAHNITAIDAALGKYESILRNVRKGQKDATDVLGMNGLSADGFIQNLFNGETVSSIDADLLGATVGEVLGTPEKGKEIGALARTIQPLWQVAQDHPEMKPAVGALFDHRGQVQQNLNRVFSHFSMEVGPDGVANWTKETQARTEKFMTRPDLVGRVDDILRLRQDKKDFLSSTDPKDKMALESVLRGLSAEDRQGVLNIAEQQSNSTMEGHQLILETNQHVETNLLASIFQRGSQNPISHNQGLAEQLMQGVQAMSDPTQAPAAGSIIEAVRVQVSPEAFLQGLQYAQGAVERLTNTKDFLDQRQWFATEQSFDRYHVTGRKTNGELVRGFGDSRDAALKMVQRQDPGARILKIVDKQDKNDVNRSYGVPPELVQRLEQNDQAMLAQLQALGFSPDALQVVQSNSAAGALRKELAASQLYKPGSERAGVAGREFLPMLANHFNYHTALVRSLQNRFTRSEVGLRLQNPDIAAKPESVALVNKALDNFMTPDSQVAGQISKGVAAYNMAFNFAGMAVEGAQSLTTHLAQLSAEGAGIIGGMKLWGSSLKEIMSWSKTGKWKNADHEEVMRRFVQDLEVGYGAWDDNLTNSEGVLARAKDLQNAGKPRGVGDYVKSAVSAYGRVGMNLYGIATHLNARMAGLMSFDHYRAQGLDFETAYQKAREFNRTVNFSGGKAARPVGVFENKGLWRGASQLMYTFRGYTLGMFSTLNRYVKQGFSGKSPLSLSERANSRKAAVQMLATMFAMGGALGLPGVEGLLTAAEDLTDLKLKQNIREGVANVLGDTTLAEGFLMGVPNMLGVDAHSRVSLGGFPGLSSYDGFSLTDLAGPAVGLAERFYTGARKSLTSGLGDGAQYLLPPSFRRLSEVLQSDSLSAGNGQLLTKYTSGEKIAMAIGFSPTRVTQMKEAERIRSRSEKIDRASTARERGQIADKVLSGDVQGAKSALHDRANTGGRDVLEEARAIASAVEDRTFPMELADKPGTNATVLSQAFGQTGHVSEVQRVQLRNHVLQQLGLPVVLSPRDLMKADMIDQELELSPLQSRSSARSRVAKYFGDGL